MDISKLKEGMVIKNYTELSHLLGIKKTGGDYKKKRLSELKDLVEFEQDGFKFIINKIYSKQEVVKNEIRRGRKSLYATMIEVLLLDELSKNETSMLITKYNLMNKIGLTNPNYKICYNNQDALANYLDMEVEYINEFYRVNENNITKILNTTLHNISRKGLIFSNETIMVKPLNERLHRQATDDEITGILGIESRAKEICNIGASESIKKHVYFMKNKKLNSLIKEMLMEELKLEFYYEALKIILNDKYIVKEKISLTDFILSENEKLNELEKLNSTFGNNVITNANNRHLASIDKRSYSIRNNQQYVDHFKLLVSKLIDLDSGNINLDNLDGAISINSSYLPF